MGSGPKLFGLARVHCSAHWYNLSTLLTHQHKATPNWFPVFRPPPHRILFPALHHLLLFNCAATEPHPFVCNIRAGRELSVRMFEHQFEWTRWGSCKLVSQLANVITSSSRLPACRKWLRVDGETGNQFWSGPMEVPYIYLRPVVYTGLRTDWTGSRFTWCKGGAV